MNRHLSPEEIIVHAAGGGSLLSRMRCWMHLRSCRMCRIAVEREQQDMVAQREMGAALRGYVAAVEESATAMTAEPTSFFASAAESPDGADDRQAGAAAHSAGHSRSRGG